MTEIVRTRIPEDSFRTCRRTLPHRQLAASSWSFCLFLLLVSSIACASAFVPTDKSKSNGAHRICPAPPSSHSALFALPGFNNNNNGDNKEENDGWDGNDLFESFKNLFWNKDTDQNGSSSSTDQNKSMGGKNNQAPAVSQFFQPLAQSSESDDEEDDDDELPAGTSLLFKIPARQLKPGGLRLFLMFYLMGMQNTPDRNTWRADQRLLSSNVSPKNLEGFENIDSAEAEPEEKTYVLEMLYDIDRTGMLQIELLPSNPKTHKQAEIRIYRCGSRPSTSYLMQESVIVDGVLDELQMITGEIPSGTPEIPRDSDEPEIADEDRLLITDPPNAIEAARESLAFS